MNMRRTTVLHRRNARGFTLVELMVTVSIALFLLGGLLTIVQNMRTTYNNQQSLVQLQDEQRFALTVITDAVQAAGYFPNPTLDDTGNTFGASASYGANFQADWLFYGSHAAGVADNLAQDTLFMRFQSAPGYGPILCNGVDTSTQPAPAQPWTVEFSINPATQQLVCTVNGAAVPLVSGVTALAVYYGVKRNGGQGYNVDTYETFNVIQAQPGDAPNIGALRVVVTFVNPLFGQPSQPATVTLERVIEVMSHGGPTT